MLRVARHLIGSRLFGLAAFGGVAIGAFLPWSKWVFMTEAGIVGDGRITFILASIGVVLIAAASQTGAATAAFLAGLCLAVGMYDVIHVRTSHPSLGGFEFDMHYTVGVGLWLTVGASAAALVASVLRWVRIRDSAHQVQQLPSVTGATHAF